MELFERYRSIVDDWPAFTAACQRPLPRVVWANPLMGDPATTIARLRARCPDATPLPWWPHAWRLNNDVRLGNWDDFRMGLLHAQEEAALWSVALLDPQPGERILDMCAAPGNKTAQIAAAMQDTGVLVANEKKRGRLSQLRANLERLGVTCAVVAAQDGNRIVNPGPDFEHYDRVLVDAPCSCEGTTRKHGDGAWRDVERYRRSVQGSQIGLLRKALKVVKPGGIVVYATCTFAPEENERVLDAIWPSVAAIEPVVPPAGVRICPGLSEWQGHTFRPDVVNAARLWPHHNDTGGFFVARLRRLA